MLHVGILLLSFSIMIVCAVSHDGNAEIQIDNRNDRKRMSLPKFISSKKETI